MSFQDTIAMPLKSFWSMYKNIDVLIAEEDLHKLSVPTPESSKEHITGFVDKAVKTYGNPIKYDVMKVDTLDRKGLNELRNMI